MSSSKIRVVLDASGSGVSCNLYNGDGVEALRMEAQVLSTTLEHFWYLHSKSALNVSFSCKHFL